MADGVNHRMGRHPLSGTGQPWGAACSASDSGASEHLTPQEGHVSKGHQPAQENPHGFKVRPTLPL